MSTDELFQNRESDSKKSSLPCLKIPEKHNLQLDQQTLLLNFYSSKGKGEGENEEQLDPKYFVGTIKHAPHFMIDNEYLLTGYRINFNTNFRILRSLCKLHNETVNVWSHIMGVTFFIALLIWTLVFINAYSNSSDYSSDN
jgi:hypothetical protein